MKGNIVSNKGKGNVAAKSAAGQRDEVHVCSNGEGGFYFMVDLNGFVIASFHEVGSFYDWILDCEDEAVENEGGQLVMFH